MAKTGDGFAASQYGDVAGSLTARYDSSPCVDRGQNIVCMTDTQANTSIEDGLSGTISRHSHKDPPVVSYAVRERAGKPGGGKGPLVSEDCSLTLLDHADQAVLRGEGDDWVVRRLMPVECERLMGFEDGWTDVDGARDGPRYKAIGNSMAVPVMRWIGRRIMEVDALEGE